jgi:hypothetical protein
MNPLVVIGGDLARLRERSLTLCQASVSLIVLSRATRTLNGEVRRLRLQAQARTVAARRESIIARKLREGRLPRASAAIISGGSGQNGRCDGCGDPLVPNQLVMAVPSSENTFVHLHADCFMLWNALRPRIGPVTDLRRLSA